MVSERLSSVYLLVSLSCRRCRSIVHFQPAVIHSQHVLVFLDQAVQPLSPGLFLCGILGGILRIDRTQFQPLVLPHVPFAVPLLLFQIVPPVCLVDLFLCHFLGRLVDALEPCMHAVLAVGVQCTAGNGSAEQRIFPVFGYRYGAVHIIVVHLALPRNALGTGRTVCGQFHRTDAPLVTLGSFSLDIRPQICRPQCHFRIAGDVHIPPVLVSDIPYTLCQKVLCRRIDRLPQ